MHKGSNLRKDGEDKYDRKIKERMTRKNKRNITKKDLTWNVTK